MALNRVTNAETQRDLVNFEEKIDGFKQGDQRSDSTGPSEFRRKK